MCGRGVIRRRCRGQAPGWAPLPVQYVDYTLWQQQVLGDARDPESVLARQFAYWRTELADAPEQIVLPWDRSRPAEQSFRGEVVSFSIPARLRHRLERLAGASGATLSMVLQAALAVLLRKCGAGDDVCIGGPIAGRTDAALDDLIGFFVNTWVLRVDTSANPTFAQLLARVRTKALAAYEHQDAPFERLVDVFNPTRSAAHHPLFQVGFALQNTALPTIEFTGMDTETLPAHTGTAKFDLLINIIETPNTHDHTQPLSGLIEYATDLFDRPTIERFAAAHERVLEAITADSAGCIDGIEVIDPVEREQVLIGGNANAVVVPRVSIGELFGAQVRGIRRRWPWPMVSSV